MVTKNTKATSTKASRVKAAPKSETQEKAGPVVLLGSNGQPMVPQTATQAQQAPEGKVAAPLSLYHWPILGCSALAGGAVASSGQIVTALGRPHGQKYGQPVINYLHRLTALGLVRVVENGHGSMYSWQLTDLGIEELKKAPAEIPSIAITTGK